MGENMKKRRRIFKKNIFGLLWAVLLVLVLAGCGRNAGNAQAPASGQEELQVFFEETDTAQNVEDAITSGGDLVENDSSVADVSVSDVGEETAPRDPFAEGTQFRNSDRFEEHYQKHVIDQQEFGDITREEYMTLAQALVDTPGPKVQTKQNSDGDTLYYDADTNSFAVVSPDGFIRTFFKPSAGQSYYDRQK